MKTEAEIREALRMSYELYHDPNTKKTLKKLEIIRTTIQALQWVLDFGHEGFIKDLYTDLKWEMNCVKMCDVLN